MGSLLAADVDPFDRQPGELLERSEQRCVVTRQRVDGAVVDDVGVLVEQDDGIGHEALPQVVHDPMFGAVGDVRDRQEALVGE